MATLRKASAYSKRKIVPFTRTSKLKNKSYIKTVPPHNIVKFSMGKPDFSKFKHHLTMISLERVQLRHNALEACRQFINKKLDKAFLDQYFFKVIPYPHHIQRENKMLTGAGADRMQSGMQLSFGKSMGKAALINPGSKIFFLALPNENAVKLAREVLKQIKSKLPCKTQVIYKYEKESNEK